LLRLRHLNIQKIERCFVRVEISKREKVLKEVEVKEFKPIYPDVFTFFVTLMSLEEMLAEKIRATVIRAKARDVYDIWFLLEKGIKVDLNLVNQMEKSWERELRPIV